MLVNTPGLKTVLNAIKEYIRKQINKIKRPDWNQNDESAQNYIKNRTHWKEEGSKRYERVPLRTYYYGNAASHYVGDRYFATGIDSLFQEYPFVILAIPGNDYYSQIHLSSLNYEFLNLIDVSGQIVAKMDLTQAKENKNSDGKLLSYEILLHGDDRIPLNFDMREFTVVLETKPIYHKIPQEYLPDDAREVVLYSKQTLTGTQQEQARQNIGAAHKNLGCNKYDVTVTTTDDKVRIFEFYTTVGEIRQPEGAVETSIKTAFFSLTAWPLASSINERTAKTFCKQYKILYDAGYIDSPCRIVTSPIKQDTNVLLSYNESNGTVNASAYRADGTYNIKYDTANDALQLFGVEKYVYANNGAIDQYAMSADPTEDMHIATKQYVDTAKTEAQQLGLTSTTPGQIIKVKAVQDGNPTEWEAVDMPGGEEWELIDIIPLTAGVTLYDIANFGIYRKIAISMVKPITKDGSGNIFLRGYKLSDANAATVNYILDSDFFQSAYGYIELAKDEPFLRYIGLYRNNNVTAGSGGTGIPKDNLDLTDLGAIKLFLPEAYSQNFDGTGTMTIRGVK
nr:MAG TPA: hypothetical protein [Caudoviricetes sp.]